MEPGLTTGGLITNDLSKHTFPINLIIWFVFVVVVLKQSQCVDQPGLELKEILLPLLPECKD